MLEAILTAPFYKNTIAVIIFCLFLKISLLFLKNKIRKYLNFSLSLLFSIIISFLMFKYQKDFSIDVINDVQILNKYINFNFVIKKWDFFYILMILILYPIDMFYALFYFKLKGKEPRLSFFLLVFLAVIFSIFIITSKNLILMFFFYELLTITTFLLVIYDRTEKAINSGINYLIMLTSTSVFIFLPAIFVVFDISGTFNLSDTNIISNLIPINDNFKYVILFLFLFGISKIAFIPFHSWLTNAMIAPTPVSALLHAVLVVKIGIFVLLTVFYDIFSYETLINLPKYFELNLITIYSIFVFIFSAINATISSVIKKKLAYSTINQLSFIVIIGSLFIKELKPFLLFYIINHSLSKINLFFFAGELRAKDNITVSDYIDKAQNINFITKLYLVISCLNMIGLPLTLGYKIKSSFYNVILENNIYEKNIILCFIVLSSIITFFYLKDILINLNFRKKAKTNSLTNYLISLPGLIVSILQLILIYKFDLVMNYFNNV